MRYAVCVVVLALVAVSVIPASDTTGVQALRGMYGDKIATLELSRVPVVHIGGRYTLPQAEPVSVELVDGELHVVMRERSNAEYPTCPSSPVPDRVWKDIYACEDGEVVLKYCVEGKHRPASRVPERFTWPEEEE